MRKLKFLSIAAAAVAMVGCSSDDLNFANENYELAKDGSEVFVTVGGQENTTRAGFANSYNMEKGTINQAFLWAKGDVFKMYCTDTWKPQLYKFTTMATVSGVNGAVFTWANDESKYNKGENPEDMTSREYAVFPAEGDEDGNLKLEFTDEFRTSLTMTITPEVDYGTPEILENSEYVQNGEKKTDMNGRMYVSNTLIPLFGFAKNDAVSFNYMTALLRVNVQGIKTGEHTLTLASETTKLSGEFVTGDFDAAKYTTSDLPKFKAEEAKTESEKSLTVKFTADNETLGTDYFIYIPVPVGTYAAGDLSLTLDKDVENGDKREITITTTGKVDLKEQETTVGAGTFLVATTAKPVVEYVSSLKELQDVVDGFANVQREAIYHIWGGTSEEKAYFEIQVPELYISSSKDETTLKVPELQAPITVYLHGKFTAPTGQQNQTLYITGTEKGKKLTLNICDNTNCTPDECKGDVDEELSASTAKIEISRIPAVELNGSFEGDVKIAATDLTIGGSFGAELTLDAATQLTLNKMELKKDMTTAALKVVVAGEISGKKTITAEKATEVVIADNAFLHGSIVANEATVNVDGKADSDGGTGQIITAKSATVNGNVYGLVTTTGKTTVASGYVKVITAGEVEISSADATQAITSITSTGNVTITNTNNQPVGTVTVTTETGKLTIAKDNTVTTVVQTGGNAEVAGTVNTMTLADGDLTVKGGTIPTLNLTNGNVTMEGGSIATLAYTSTEDAEKANTVTTTGDAVITTVTVDGEAYDAENKSVLAFTSTWTGETVTALTEDANNIFTAAQLASIPGGSVKAFNLYTDVTIGENVTWTSKQFRGNFNGNGNVIKNLNNPLFGSWYCTGARARAIKDITFENANVTGGVLANAISAEAKLTVSGITVKSATITGKENLGAIAGAVSGTVSFVDNTINKSNVNFAVTDADKLERVLESGPAGTVGYYVGTIVKGSTVEITSDATDLKFTAEQKKAFGFDKNVTTGLGKLEYYGFDGCGWVGFSEGATEETLKVNGKSVKINTYSETPLTNN